MQFRNIPMSYVWQDDPALLPHGVKKVLTNRSSKLAEPAKRLTDALEVAG
jgi:hypothetical protein